VKHAETIDTFPAFGQDMNWRDLRMATTNGIPAMGFGTFGRTGSAGIDALLFALETGYRHLDTAQSYGTERECGEALRRSGLAREDVFVTTKTTGENSRRGKLIESLKRSNEAIGVDAVDLTLIHWPVDPRGKLPKAEYLPELAEAQDLGLTRLIGVSNFTIADIEEAETILGPDTLATNQFERHPLLRNQKLVDSCVRHGIAVTCYLPLARGRCAGIPAIETIAKTRGATPHQIALAASLTEGHIVIPTSGQHDRIAENFAARSITLSPTELQTITALDRNERQINPVWSPAWD
jgi:2,5-diketo-D-gluconate reductase B